MFNVSQNIHQVQTVFGPGYVLEQHADQSNLVDDGEARFAEFVRSLRALVWNDDAVTRH